MSLRAVHPRSSAARRLTGGCVLLLSLAGCSEQALYSQLGEREANEMVATLSEAGLSASKRGEIDGGFSVSISSGAFGEAVAVLQRNGLPRERYETIGDVFAKEGFVSSPLEERARLNFALSQEIAHTISSIDGVLMARVHLAVPQRDELGDTVAPASASVFVKHRDTVDLSGSVGSIKALVVNGIENLPYENVTVALFASESAPVTGVAVGDSRTDRDAGARLSSDTALAAVAPFAGPLSAVLLLVGGALCAWFGWFRGHGISPGSIVRADRTGARRAASDVRGAAEVTHPTQTGKE